MASPTLDNPLQVSKVHDLHHQADAWMPVTNSWRDVRTTALQHALPAQVTSALSAQNAMPQGAWEKNSPTFTTLAPHDAGATHKRSSREISQDARTSCSSGSTDGKSPGSALLKLYHLRACPRPTTDFAVLKLSNIAWNLSIADVVAYFAPISVPVAHLPPHYTQGVHIIMNRSTGKTQGDCFIEFPTFTDAQRALELHARGILKGRVVIAQWSTQSELMDALFPYRQTISGRTELRQPNADHATNQLTRVVQYVPAGSGLVYGPSYPTSSREGIFLLRDEIDALLLVCRNYKLHFSRKCAERPFENIISILSKVSWHDPECLSVSHRDHLFEMLKLSLESLKIHKSRSDHHIDETLMERMVRAGLCVPLFTERQKLTLVTVARMDVPPDLSIFVYNPPDDTSSLGRQDGDTCQASTMGVATTHVDLDQDVGHAASIKAPQCVIEQNCPTTGTVPWREQDAMTPSTGNMSGAAASAYSGFGSISLYPSPPSADESRGDPATPTPASSLGTLFKPEPEADAGMSVSLLSARIRMLEQALRQSETRYDDLRKQHESTVMKSQAEQRELINGKLRMERRCHELEALGRQLEQANAELEQRCSRLQHLLQQIPADGSLKDVANAEDCGHASLRNSPGGIDSDTVRNLWK